MNKTGNDIAKRALEILRNPTPPLTRAEIRRRRIDAARREIAELTSNLRYHQLRLKEMEEE